MKFDNNFLDEVGLSSLPPEQKQAFLAHIQEELEVRVGEKMSEGLSQNQIEEFEGIMNNDQNVIRKVVSELGMDFRQDPLYQQILKKYNVAQGTWEMIGEYLSIKWIQKNRPDYRTVVEETANTLKQEIINNRSSILGQPAAA